MNSTNAVILLFFALTQMVYAQNPSLVKDINPGTSSSRPSFFSKTSNNLLLFTANDGVHGTELWKTDGTTVGTSLVKDIYPGSTTSFSSGVGDNFILSANNISYFVAMDHNNGFELWKTDGTATGTSLIKDINPGTNSSLVSEPTLIGDTLFFRANDGGGYRLWKSDGTANGTVKVHHSYDPDYLVNYDNTLFFTSGTNLIKTDGTSSGTNVIKSFNSNSPSTFFDPEFSIVNNTLFFPVYENNKGYELWKSDGTPNGTVLVKDIRAGVNSSNPRKLTNVNGVLFFIADDGVHGFELWKSDGTANGTVMVKDINPGLSSGAGFFADKDMAALGGMLLFVADDGQHGPQLWKSDGTSNGTVMVKNISYTSSVNGFSAYPNNFVMGDSEVFFTITGKGLYKTDGSTSGTQLMVPDSIIQISYEYQNAAELIYKDHKLYFQGPNGVTTNNSELWVYDPSSPTTNITKVEPSKQLATIYPNPNYGVITVDLEQGGKVELSLLDARGKILLHKNIDTTQEINTQKLSSGIYFVKLVSEDNIQVIRLVKN